MLVLAAITFKASRVDIVPAMNWLRMIPPSLSAETDTRSWTPPVVFDSPAEAGPVEKNEVFGTFDMRVGMIVTVKAEREGEMLSLLEEQGEKA